MHTHIIPKQLSSFHCSIPTKDCVFSKPLLNRPMLINDSPLNITNYTLQGSTYSRLTSEQAVYSDISSLAPTSTFHNRRFCVMIMSFLFSPTSTPSQALLWLKIVPYPSMSKSVSREACFFSNVGIRQQLPTTSKHCAGKSSPTLL